MPALTQRHPLTRTALLILLGCTSEPLLRCSMAAWVMAVNTLWVECMTRSAPAPSADSGMQRPCWLLCAPAASPCCTPCWGPAVAEVAPCPCAAASRVCARGLKWPPCASSTSSGTPCCRQMVTRSAAHESPQTASETCPSRDAACCCLLRCRTAAAYRSCCGWMWLRAARATPAGTPHTPGMLATAP